MKNRVLKILMVVLVIGGNCLHAGKDEAVSNESLAGFGKELKKIYPAYKSLAFERDYVYSVNDTSGKKLGSLYLETVADSDREFGYSGTIEVGLVIGLDNKIEGMVVGRNVESAAYLARVKNQLSKKWNNLELKDVLGYKVDAVSGATYSSSAIIVGVKKLAKDHLKSDTPIIVSKPEPMRRRSAGQGDKARELNSGIERLVTQYRQQPSEQTKGELKELLDWQADNEIAEFTQRSNTLNRIVAMSDLLLKQWQTRKDEEIDMRVAAALEGADAAVAFGKEKKMIYFSHPRRGGENQADTEMDDVVKAYKENPTEANKEQIRKLVTERLDLQLETVPIHNSDQEKAYKGTKAYLENLTANKEQIVERRLSSLLKQY